MFIFGPVLIIDAMKRTFRKCTVRIVSRADLGVLPGVLMKEQSPKD